MVETLAPIKPSSPGWTDERIDLAKRLYIDGLSASQIAAELGGITRNAVIGKIHRGGWERPLKATRGLPAPRLSRSERIRHRASLGAPTRRMTGSLPPLPTAKEWSQIEPSALSTDDIPRHQRRTMATLGERHCRWPCGDPGTPDFFFCGGVRKDAQIPIERGGVPYCATHCQTAFIPAPRRRTPYVYRGPHVSP